MRRLIFCLLILMGIVSFCNAQDTIGMNELFKVFRNLDSPTDAYTHIQPRILEGPFISREVMTIEKENRTGGVENILILVDSSLYLMFKDKIHRYAYDVHWAYGCGIKMVSVFNQKYYDVKVLLRRYYLGGGIDGAVLIGDFPAGWFEMDQQTNSGDWEHVEFPTDLYYMDLDGVWDGRLVHLFNSHSGNVEPEIFIGRISTKNMGKLISEKEGMEKYLDKNHDFWIGKKDIKKKYALAYVDKDWSSESFAEPIKKIYGEIYGEKILYWDNPDLLDKYDYINRLNNSKYEFIQLMMHSSYDYHKIVKSENVDSIITSSEIFNQKIKAIALNLFCCKACNWSAVTSDAVDGFLGGAYVYNPKSSVLTLIGSTKTGSIYPGAFRCFYQPLGEGKTFGESHLEMWHNYGGSTNNGYIHEIKHWHYGLTIIGDPMINLHYCMRDKCQQQITLTTFPNISRPYQYYLAKDLITTQAGYNYIIPSGIHVMMRANTIILDKGFECKIGCTMEIEAKGCIMGNCE